MRPAARLRTIAELLPQALSAGQPADRLVQQWGRQNRYAGSKDRRDIADRVFSILRHYGDLTARLGGDDPLLVTLLATHLLADVPLDEVVTLADGSQYAAPPIAAADEKTLRHAAATPVASRAATLSVPEWLLADIDAHLGDDADDVMQAMLARAPTDLRVNLLKADRDVAQAALLDDDVETLAHETISTALRLQRPAQITVSKAYQSGMIEVQDAGAQAVADICQAKPFETVMDFCCGAGGKALALAAAMDNKGRLLVHDAIDSRMRQLPERAARAGVDIIETVPPAQLRDFEAQCDLVVVDVPCSGSGRWRRAPETKWRLTAEALADLHQLQAEILRQAAALVKPGGRLAYITCSLLGSENRHQVDQFLEENQLFQSLEIDGPVRRAAHHKLHPLNADSDGLYVAVLQQAEERDGA